MRVLVLLLLVFFNAASRAAAQPNDPGWQGTILIEILPSADPMLDQALTDSRLRQSLINLAPLTGRPQPAELLHWIVSLNARKAILEARWYGEITSTGLTNAFAAALQIDPQIADEGMLITIFTNKDDARAYFDATITEWLPRVPPTP